MSKKIHHVGLAVKNIEETFNLYKNLMGAELLPHELETPEFCSRLMKVDESLFELLEPRGDNGLIERFIERQGEGIHHVSMMVSNVDEILAYCRANDIRTIGDRFIHPSGTHGVLIELIPEPIPEE